jgi:glucose-1-phosphate thymidylyltransferase
MKLLVLAAGYATRLRPLTDHVAKPLLPVKGRPMIDHVLASFHGCPEIDEVYVVTNHRYAESFERWAVTATAHHNGWPIRVFDDGTHTNEDRLGAIGDINFVIDQSKVDDDLIIVAGDNLFTQSLTGFAAAAQKLGVLVGVFDVGDLVTISQYASVTLDSNQRIIAFEEKPQQPTSTLAAVALYHYPRMALPLIKQYIAEGNNADQPGRLVQWLVQRLPVYAYPIGGQWLDIGSKESYQAAQSIL